MGRDSFGTFLTPVTPALRMSSASEHPLFGALDRKAFRAASLLHDYANAATFTRSFAGDLSQPHVRVATFTKAAANVRAIFRARGAGYIRLLLRLAQRKVRRTLRALMGEQARATEPGLGLACDNDSTGVACAHRRSDSVEKTCLA